MIRAVHYGITVLVLVHYLVPSLPAVMGMFIGTTMSAIVLARQDVLMFLCSYVLMFLCTLCVCVCVCV
jgi:hypothetical protein